MKGSDITVTGLVDVRPSICQCLHLFNITLSTHHLTLSTHHHIIL